MAKLNAAKEARAKAQALEKPQVTNGLTPANSADLADLKPKAEAP